MTFWDSLGWRDRSASEQFDARHATPKRPCTPGCFFAVKERLSWRRSPHVYEQLPDTASGVLKLGMTDTTADIAFTSAQPSVQPMVALA
ncbi:MAG: hypothetical protein K2Y51_10615 [Gammaproteobacteria bacterium]|nr:hypothetical protein [Gammaproteobacteria bacterium]